MQLKTVCTSLKCNKPVVVYYNLSQNVCNDRLPVTEETKKDQLLRRISTRYEKHKNYQVVFRNYFQESFTKCK